MRSLSVVLRLTLVVLGGGPSCFAGSRSAEGPDSGGGGGTGQGGNAASDGGGLGGDGGHVDAPAERPPVTSFPTRIVLGDPTLPTTVPALFDTPARTSGQPCLISPEPGTLMPKNWLRPRFEFTSLASENLFEITMKVARFADPVRIYTREKIFALTPELWNWMRDNVVDETIELAVRGLEVDSDDRTVILPPSPAAVSSFTIAPVQAPGKIVYWAISGGNGVLKGFGVGEEGVREVLRGEQVETRDPGKTCVGCHTATPDGESVGFSMGTGGYYNFTADIGQAKVGGKPKYMTDAAVATIAGLRGIPAYSKAHWSPGDRIVLLSDIGVDLHWVQLDGDQRGVVARAGDARKVTEPTFSHDGKTIVYVSSAGSIVDGRAAGGPMDLYVVPYADRAGGNATPLTGAADPDHNEYYPAFSPDDALVAFTRLAGAGNSYDQPNAEVFVVPSTGGEAVRLKANDAAACQTALRSPGLSNGWPKWSPSVTTAGNKTYYWLTFSSRRTGAPQLFVTAYVEETRAGAPPPCVPYPALYLWNQPPDEGNHTPSWEDYKIPPVVVK